MNIISRISSTDKDNSEDVGIKLIKYNGLEVINKKTGRMIEMESYLFKRMIFQIIL